MPNRDALWVMPNGVTTVVTVDEQGNLVEPVHAVEPEAVIAPAPPVEPVRRRGRGRKNR